jgi:hypothetical protein
MPTLTIDVGGGSQMDLYCEKAGHAAPRRVGSKGFSASGSEHSQIRAEPMVVPVILAPLPTATIATIRGLFALGAHVACRGDVFNNANATTVCSGTITDELHITGDRWTANLTLYEIGTTLGYTPTQTIVYLTNVVSPTDATKNLASTDANDDPFSAGTGGINLLAGPGDIPTCGTFPDPLTSCAVGTSAAPEISFLSEPSPNGGYITGAPTVNFHSTGGVGDAWATQDMFAKIYIVRSGVDVAEFDTGFSNGNGGFSGGTVTAAAASIIFAAAIGDRVRVDVYGRAALHSGYSVGTLQHISFGNLGAGVHFATLVWGGSVLFE